ncbi:MAG: hypothetical protein ACLPUT_15080 [Solirubrobacteraceae bacterium]
MLTVCPTLVVSGLACVIGALCARQWGPPNGDLFGLDVAGIVLIVSGVMGPVLADKLGEMSIRSHHTKFVLAVVAVAAAVLASERFGTPAHLPGIALGWPLLLHLERGSALVAAIGIIGLVLWRGAHNEWPESIGNFLKYAPKAAVQETAEAFAEQEERFAILEELLGGSRPGEP